MKTGLNRESVFTQGQMDTDGSLKDNEGAKDLKFE